MSDPPRSALTNDKVDEITEMLQKLLEKTISIEQVLRDKVDKRSGLPEVTLQDHESVYITNNRCRHLEE